MYLIRLMRASAIFFMFLISFLSFASNIQQDREWMILSILKCNSVLFSRENLENMACDLLQEIFDSYKNEIEFFDESQKEERNDVLALESVQKIPVLEFAEQFKMDDNSIVELIGNEESCVKNEIENDCCSSSLSKKLITDSDKMIQELIYEQQNLNMQRDILCAQWSKLEEQGGTGDTDTDKTVLLALLGDYAGSVVKKSCFDAYKELPIEKLWLKIEDVREMFFFHLKDIRTRLRQLNDISQIDLSFPRQETVNIKMHDKLSPSSVSLTQIAVAEQDGHQCGANAIGLACAIITSKLNGAYNAFGLKIDNLMDYRWNKEYFKALSNKENLANISQQIGYSVIEESSLYGNTLEQCDETLLTSSWIYGKAAVIFNGEPVPLHVLSIDRAFLKQGTTKQDIQDHWKKHKANSACAHAFLINTVGHWFTLVVVQNEGGIKRNYFVSDSKSSLPDNRLYDEPLNTDYPEYTTHSIVRFIESAIREVIK